MHPRFLRLGSYFLTSAVMLLASIVTWEGLYVGLLASPEALRARYFGGEAMRSHGGVHYRSAGAYLASVTYVAIPLLLLAAALASLLWARRPPEGPGTFPWRALHPRRVLSIAGVALLLLGWAGLWDPRHRRNFSLDPDPSPAPALWPAATSLATGFALLMAAAWAVRCTRDTSAG